MYWTVLSSFFITELEQGRFSWIHGLSVFTFCTLSLGTWAAIRGRIRLHRQFMVGSYFGLLGAFAGAVAVPQRDVPQLLVQQPLVFTAAVLAVTITAVTVIAFSRGRVRPRATRPTGPTLAR